MRNLWCLVFGRSAKWSAYMSSNGKHPKLPFRSTGRSLGGRSAKISFNNNITYYTWQIWPFIVEICNCHVGGVFGVLGCWGGYIWHDCTMLTDCLLTYLFRNKRKFPTFLEESKWLSNTSHNTYPRMHLGGYIYQQICQLSVLPTRCQYQGSRSASRSANFQSWQLDVSTGGRGRSAKISFNNNITPGKYEPS